MAAILKVRDTDGTVHEIHALQGKSAYQYAVEGGYTGTETEFAKKLASGALIVTITDNNGTLSADKSYNDIYNAINAGTTVLVSYGGTGLTLVAAMVDSLCFGAIQCDNDETGAMIATPMIEITVNNEVNDFSAQVDIPKTLPNPNALTFTGAVTGSYDGSEAVTVEIPSGGGGGFEVLVDFTTEEAVTEFTIPKTVIGPLTSKIQEASMLIMQIGVPRDTTDTSITTNGTISIKAYIGWLDDIAGGAFNCIIAPSETYNSTYTKNVLFTKVPKSARTNDNQACLVNIWGGKNNASADATVTRTVINHLNSFYGDSYLTIVGSQTMAAGTRFIMGVIA